jgi:large subunit ribosomal protein L18
MSYRSRLAAQETRRRFRVRNRLVRDAHGRPRLSVFRSNRHMYAQIIDDSTGKTLAQASSLDSGLAGPGGVGGDVETAAKVGELVAQRALSAGVAQVVFDRGIFRYHGRIAALAEAARAAGLDF